MAAMPSYQFYTKKPLLMDSLQSSVSKFNAGTSLQLFRLGSSIPLTNHCFRAICGSRYADSTRNSHKQFNRLLGKKKGGGNFHVGEPISRPGSNKIESRNSWLDNWDVAPKPGGGKTPQAVVNYRNKGDISGSDAEEGTSTSTRGSTMQRIVEKLKKFGYIDDVSEKNEDSRGMMEDLFHVEEGLLPNTRGGFSEEFPFGDKSVVARSNGKVRFPWEKNEQRPSLDSRSNRSLAKLTLPELEINRLTNMALRMKNKTKIGAAGVTQQVVEMIQEKWKSSEVVRLKIEGPPALNMRRVHETLERKTGGLVVWRSGTSVALYRGAAYEDPAQNLKKKAFRKNELPKKIPDKSGQESPNSGHLSQTDPHKAKVVRAESSDLKPEESSEVKYEDEIDELLNSLGPRYEDWPGDGPLPVDADLLPGIVPGYQPPFRLLPYGVRPSLGVKDATALRRLARVLPPHFAVGRSRQHQGLAAAIVKLWERSSIAKIALKRGVQLTTSERMAEDLKRLTGGMLLSRNKDFLVYYRGKNFLSPDVAEALLEKERLAKALQDEEERARLRASTLVIPSEEDTVEFGTAGTLKETLDADSKWGKRLDDEYKEKVMREAEVLRHANIVRKLERKLSFALRKLTKAERALSKVEEFLTPADPSEDLESLTDEERFMFRKLGLRMKAFLLLGRRGVFGGTVENMHLHWKYRELVKIIVKAPNIEEVKSIALALEAESGGVLVSVDKISKGYAIIVFRGRHYERPPILRPKNLLTKRKALARSIELQRRQDIMNHVSTLQTRVNQLRSEIEQVAAIKDQGDDELYSRLDSAYSTEDDDSEEEGDDAYLKYESENDTVDENIEPVRYTNPETDNNMADPDIDTVHSTYQETYFSCGTHPEPETEFAEP